MSAADDGAVAGTETVTFDFSESRDAPTASSGAKAAAKRKRAAEQTAALNELPSAQMYEKSFMHRDLVTHVAVGAHDFILTASADGDLRFWKKTPEDCVFVKRYRSHKSAVCALEVSPAGDLCATMCHDGTAKVYDVSTFDMIVMLRLAFVPGCCAFLAHRRVSERKLAISERDAPRIHIFDVGSGSNEAIRTLEDVHQAPVTCMRANAAHGTVVSCDVKGFVKYWDAETYTFPAAGLRFTSMFATSLMDCVKEGCYAKHVAVSHGGALVALSCSDLTVRVVAYDTGRARCRLAAGLQGCEEELEGVDAIEVGKRQTQEKEVAKWLEGDTGPVAGQWFSAAFDSTGAYVLYPAWRGVCVANVATGKVERRLGTIEDERYLQIALFQGVPRGKKKAKMEFAMGKEMSTVIAADPTLVACALNRSVFYLFSTREPEDTEDAMLGRDVFNEKPTEEEALADPAAAARAALPAAATLHTSLGDITARLHGEAAPKTVENFTTHARNGYYDGVLFHRVIKDFMLQTGDPKGDGTGGESIWGGEFEDEIVASLTHDRPGILSMANAGRNTNGSQFFITTVPTPWLNGKHTVFGAVVRGMDTVSLIEGAKTNKKTDKPWDDIKIVSISLHDRVPVS